MNMRDPSILSILASVIFIGLKLISISIAVEATSTLPIPRIETGMHSSMILRVSANKSCSLILTSSTDKTLRLWSRKSKDAEDQEDRETLRLERVFRVPLAADKLPENHGKIYATALSPDGALVAAGGWLESETPHKWQLYIFSAVTGELVDVKDDLPQRIIDLKFSPDGRFLGGVFRGGGGVIVWRTQDWSPILQESYDVSADSYGLDFDAKSESLFTVAFDGYLRRYELANGSKVGQKIKLESGSSPYQVSVNLRNNWVAVAYVDASTIDVLDPNASYQSQVSLSMSGVTGVLGRVAWSRDGNTLFAAGKHKKNNKTAIRAWMAPNYEGIEDIPVDAEIINHLLTCENGVLFGSREAAFGLVSDGKLSAMLRNERLPEMKTKRHGHLRVSDDGSRVRFGLGPHSQQPVIFDLLQQQLFSGGDGDATGLLEPKLSSSVSGWEDNMWGHTPPTYDGVPLGRWSPLDQRPRELVRSYAISPLDDTRFVVGSEWRLRSYTTINVAVPKWEVQIPADAWAVNISGDGKYVVCALGDGTVRWYRSDNGLEVLALFVDAKRKSWIAWTPQGYFMSSIGGPELLGWQVDRSRKEAPRFFEAYRFSPDFQRPDIVQRILATGDIDEAIRLAGYTLETEKKNLAEWRPPQLTLASAEIDGGISSDFVQIPVNVDETSKLKLTNWTVLINGHATDSGAPNSGNRLDTSTYEIDISVPRIWRKFGDEIRVTIIPYSESYRGVAASFITHWAGTNFDGDVRPKLYGLTIGISGYRHEDWRLKWGARDAVALQSALSKANSEVASLFRERPEIYYLTDDGEHRSWNIELDEKYSGIDKATIRDAINKLKLRVKFDPNPLTIITYSGHGGMDGPTFFLRPRDPKSGEDLADTGIRQEELYQWLSEIPGTKLLFIDACRAGDGARALRANIAGFMNAIRSGPEMNLFAFASSDSGELSRECDNLQHGCFTAALLDAIRDGAAAKMLQPDDITTTDELDRYLSEKVTKLSEGRQKPILIRSHEELTHRVMLEHR